MGRLKSALLSKNSDKKDKVKIYNPKNCETLKIPFKSDKIAKVVGKLAAKPSLPSHIKMPEGKKQHTEGPPPDQIISGVLVQNDFKLSLMAPEDLREYAGLTTTVVTCRQRVAVRNAGAAMVRWAMESMFGAVLNLPDTDANDDEDVAPAVLAKMKKNKGEENEATGEVTGNTFQVMDCITIRCRRGYIEVEWEGNIINDGLADAVIASLLSLECSPAAVKCMSLITLNGLADY